MWCIVPFKILTRGKQRLAGMLPDRQRAGLCRAMIEDLLCALQQVQLLEGTLIVSDDAEAAGLAQKYGMDVIDEDGSRGAGLNHAVNTAIERLTAASISDIMIIHGDLPLVTAADLTTLIQHHARHGKRLLTLVPDRWGRGSNCLIASSCSPIPICFGTDSLAQHRRAAAQQGIPFRTAEVPSIMFDIDTPADLLELKHRLNTMDSGSASRTRHFLETLDAPQAPRPCTLPARGTAHRAVGTQR